MGTTITGNLEVSRVYNVFRTLNDTFLTRMVYIGNFHNFLGSM